MTPQEPNEPDAQQPGTPSDPWQNPPPAAGPPPGNWQQPPSYGVGGYGAAYPVPVSGTTILVLGILSLFCFGVVLGPIAWVMGNSALKAIDSGQANPAERGNVSAGRICGMIGTILWILGVVGWIFWTVVAVGIAASGGAGSH